MSAPAQRRWTLRFVDDAIERAYLAGLALQLRRQVCVVLTLVLAVWIAAWPLDAKISGSPGNTEVSHWMRGVAAIFLGAGSVALWLLPVSTYVRWHQLIILLSVGALSLAWSLAAFVVPDPELIPLSIIVQSWVLGVLAAALLYGMRLELAIAFITVATLGVLAIAVIMLPQTTQSDGFNTLAAGALGVVGSWLLDRARRETFVANLLLDQERHRADDLLENVLPAPIAARLKAGERRIAEQFPEATVLFADLVGFTALAAEIPAAELVDRLDAIFSEFDDVAGRFGLEKIKTIGDAYMVVAGVPLPRADHASAIADAALAMRDAIASHPGLAVRIGVHTGPVIAGVIGKRKFIYDLWGDTVNLASRMESHGVAGAIQISAATAAALGGAFTLEDRGDLAIKGKGEQRAYLLTGRV